MAGLTPDGDTTLQAAHYDRRHQSLNPGAGDPGNLEFRNVTTLAAGKEETGVPSPWLSSQKPIAF